MSKHVHIEGTGKPLKVVAEQITEAANGITPDVEYPVTSFFEEPTVKHGWGFYIKNDYGFRKACNEKRDFEVEGGNWIVTERAPV